MHGYLTVPTMTKAYDVSFNMEWVRETRWTGLLKQKNISMHWRLLSLALLPWGDQTIPDCFTCMRGRLWVLQWLTQEHGGKPMVHGMTKCLRAVAAVVEMVKNGWENCFIISFDFIHYSLGVCCFAQFEDRTWRPREGLAMKQHS